jgi:hypothetical protein
MSYRGQKKTGYEKKRRSRFPPPFHNRSRRARPARPSASDSGLYPAQATPSLEVSPFELWLQIPHSFSSNGVESRLPSDPAILDRQAFELVRVAEKRDCELQLRVQGSEDIIQRFKVDRITSLSQYKATITDAHANTLKKKLESLGWTLILIPDEKGTVESLNRKNQSFPQDMDNFHGKPSY